MTECLDNIVAIGGLKIVRNEDGTAKLVGNMAVRRKMGIITFVAKMKIFYDDDGKFERIAKIKAHYNSDGVLGYIGGMKVHYEEGF